MTINIESCKNIYTGTSSTGPFTYGFEIADSTDLLVLQTDLAGTETTLALNVDYTVTGVGVSSGGTVTLTTAITAGYTLTIMRAMPYLQEENFVQGTIYATALNDGLDKLEMELQQLVESSDRGFQLPRSSSLGPLYLDPSSSSLIGWNSTATGLTNYPPAYVSLTVPQIDYTGNYGNSLNTAVAAIGTNPRLLMVKGAVTLTASLTIPANIQLWIPVDAMVNLAGYTLTLNGPFSAGLYHVFSGSGTVTFGTGSVPEVYAEWWGAKGDGTTDSTAAITAALATGIPVKLPYGTYKLTSAITPAQGTLLGSGWGFGAAQATTLKFYNLTATTSGAINTRTATQLASFVRFENLGIFASSWDGTTGCLGYGLDLEAPAILKNVRVYGFKKSNIWMHENVAGSSGPYQSVLENVYSSHSGEHGCLVGTGANTVTLVNFQGKFNGATAYGVAPVAYGNYDGFQIEMTADGGSYPLYWPEGLTILGGDCSYNSRYGWNFVAVHNSTAIFPSYAEGNYGTISGERNIAFGGSVANCFISATCHNGAATVDWGAGYYKTSNIYMNGIYYGYGDSGIAPHSALLKDGTHYLTDTFLIQPDTATGDVNLKPYGTSKLYIGTTPGDMMTIGANGVESMHFPTALVADGTGSTGTLLKVGGTGRPQTTAQAGWLAIGTDSSGAAIWIPVWK